MDQEVFIFPTSFAQQRLWFLEQLAPGSAAYTITQAVQLRGPLHVAALQQALDAVVARHETLRTTFATRQGQPVQLIAPTAAIALVQHDLQALAPADQRAAVQQLQQQQTSTPFDLRRGPLLRITLLRLEPTTQVLVLTLHHLIADGWSVGVLLRELVTLYAAARQGAPAPLAPLPIQYADLVQWQHETLVGPALDARLAYWRAQLAGAPEMLDLPTDRPRLAHQTFQGARQSLQLSAAVTAELRRLSRAHESTLFMTLLAAWALLLARLSDQDDLCVGTPIANRTTVETEALIGLLINTLVLRVTLDGTPTFATLLRRVRETCLHAYAHQDLPFEKLVEALQPTRDLSRSPLFQVLFILQSAPMPTLELADLRFTPLETFNDTAKFDLTLSFAEHDSGLNGFLEYNTDLFDATTIQRMAGYYQTIVETIIADPEQQIMTLPLLSPGQQHEMLAAWNDTRISFPEHLCVHQLFEAQVARTPDATSLIFEDVSLTYAELNARANQLAHYLRARGVGGQAADPVYVGICAERSIELVIGLLGILKAGGAYVPLDPTYPQERSAAILADAQIGVLLTQRRLVEQLPVQTATVVCLDDDWPSIAQECAENPVFAVPADATAYLIYTSGSTGQPKGVMNTHRGVVNFFVGMDQQIGCDTSDTLLAVTSISFDISVLELFWTLTRGARVVLLGEQVAAGSVAQQRLDEPHTSMDFSLFYFSSDASTVTNDKYRLLLEGTKFADTHGFTAVWTPERHFHPFGGLYPNPSVTSAALATITERIQIRAGSVVMPLHDPLRVAEEWAVVDNLSHGRVGIAFASGWHADDFAFFPERFASRKAITVRGIEAVQQLWRGEEVMVQGGAGNQIAVRIFPQPIQPELPIWITSGGNPETFTQAGAIGANVLTHLLGQRIEDLAQKIRLYREARAQHGHDPQSGRVTLMLHTFLGTDRAAVREHIRGPFTSYLRSSIDLIENLIKSLDLPFDRATMSESDLDDVLAFAFDRYFETSALFGTPETCLPMVAQLKAIGVDELACLIDFGVDVDDVLGSLQSLHQLMELDHHRPARRAYSLTEQALRYPPSLLQCTPSLIQMLLLDPATPPSLESLRVLMLGGEALPAALAAQVKQTLPSRLINMYGPTETTIWSMTHEIHQPGDTIPIGRPIANTQIYLLDRYLQPTPVGVTGELYIGGAGLAHGYHNRPALTAERFIPNPFGASGSSGERLYWTGDLARYQPDGTVVFLGRRDQQVKVRGHRIELQEIEVLLGRHPLIRDCAVVAREDVPGDVRLVAYVVEAEPRATNHEPRDGTDGSQFSALGSVPELRAFLSDTLPDYMIPTAFVLLDTMPLTPNGKLDRRALTERPLLNDSSHQQDVRFVAPRTPVEQLVAGIWADVLRREHIGVHDEFFQLGGHSLLAMQIVTRVRSALHVELPLRSLFEQPTVAALSTAIERAQASTHGLPMLPLQPVAHDKPLPLSFAQQRLWFLDQLVSDGSFYNDAAAMWLDGPLDVTILQQSLDEIVRRHEALRTTIVTVDGQPFQVSAAALATPLTFIGLHDQTELMVARLIADEAQRPFDLAHGPLLRVSVLQTHRDDDRQEHVLLLTIHHIITDGWSLRIFFQELATLYTAFSAGQPSPLAPLPIQYADFAVWQRQWLQGQLLDQQLRYWRDQLGGDLPVLQLPTDRPRPPIETFAGAIYRFALSHELTETLQSMSRREGVTLFMTLLAAWQVLLARYSGQDDIVVGTPIASRGRAELEPLIGVLLNTLVLRTRLADKPTFRSLLAHVRDTCLDAYAHQHLPFEMVVEALQPERLLSHQPLFQVMFALQNAPLAVVELPGLTMRPLEIERRTVKFDLALEVREEPDGLQGWLEYNTDLFDTATIVRMAEHWQTLLTAIAANPGQRVADLPLLTNAEQERLLVTWNATASPVPHDRCVHELFEAQVKQSPQALALSCASQQITYHELNSRANQVAHYLQSLGVGLEKLVAVCMERSIDLIVAMVGILKAGGAYVPLDPAAPPERLSAQLNDARPLALLTHQALKFNIAPPATTALCMDDDGSRLRHMPDHNPASSVRLDQLAYVMYSSESTGQSKAVMLEHRGLSNLITWHHRAFAVAATDRAMQFAAPAFDTLAWEIWPYLTAGASIAIPDDKTRLVLELLRDWLVEQQITIGFLPTALAEQMLLLAWPSHTALRTLLTGADPLHRFPPPGLPFTLVNTYGPTENSVVTTSIIVPPVEDASTMPAIGRPIDHVQVYLLDVQRRLVPIGVPGELYVGGAGLARGYLNQPELTQERFIADPFRSEPGARLYATGDKARYRPDGTIEFLGRLDDQVNIRGFRIELSEIEVVLHQHSLVGTAAVLAREDVGGHKQLVAYIVLRTGAATPEAALADRDIAAPTSSAQTSIESIDEIQRFLLDRLPAYIVPAAFVLLDAMPLDRNGKVDRDALPAPAHSASTLAQSFVPPETPVERALAQIWAEVLGISQISVHDNFFTLGGDSLLVMQVVSRSKQVGILLTPRQVFEHQTIANLARSVDKDAANPAPAEVIRQDLERSGPVPLTPIQRWFFDQRLATPDHWNQARLVEVTPGLDPGLLEQALRVVILAHDSLRLRFVPGSTGWQQIVGDVDRALVFTNHDLSKLPDQACADEITRAATQRQASLNLLTGPLIQVILFSLGPDRPARLLLIAHHLIIDTASWWIVLEDLQTAYTQLRDGQSINLPPRTTSYIEWAERLAAYADSDQLVREIDFWTSPQRHRFTQLPVDGQAERTESAASSVSVALSVEETAHLLRELPRVSGTAITDVLMTALVLSFARWTGIPELLVDLEGHGREDLFADVSLLRTVGWFTTVFPMYLSVEGVSAPAEALKLIQAQLRQIPQRGIGYGVLRYLSRHAEIRERLDSLPQAEVAFNYLGQFDQMLSRSSLFSMAREASGPVRSPSGRRPYLLEINALVINEQFQVGWTYSAGVHRRETIAALADDFITVLRSLL